MDIYLSVLIIILAIIGFLILYYYNSRIDEKRKGRRLPLNRVDLVNRVDLETGEEMGVDRDMLEKIGPEVGMAGEDQSDVQQAVRPEGRSVFQQTAQPEAKTGFRSEEWKEILPEKYGQTFIRLLIKDPRYLYCYWEIDSSQHSYYSCSPLLRLHNEDEGKYYEIAINHHSNDWYIKVKPDCAYHIQIGYWENGEFHPLASSNSVRTPLAKPSDRIDEHWMMIEELSRYTFRVEMDTLEMMKNIERRRIEEELRADSYSLVKE